MEMRPSLNLSMRPALIMTPRLQQAREHRQRHAAPAADLQHAAAARQLERPDHGGQLQGLLPAVSARHVRERHIFRVRVAGEDARSAVANASFGAISFYPRRCPSSWPD